MRRLTASPGAAGLAGAVEPWPDARVISHILQWWSVIDAETLDPLRCKCKPGSCETGAWGHSIRSGSQCETGSCSSESSARKSSWCYTVGALRPPECANSVSHNCVRPGEHNRQAETRGVADKGEVRIKFWIWTSAATACRCIAQSLAIFLCDSSCNASIPTAI